MELALATELLNRDEKNFKILITLDELKVEVHLEFDETYSMWIVSEDTTDTLYQIEFSDEYTVYSVVGFAKAIEKTLATLEQLYYYKPLGKYISREDKMELLKYKTVRLLLAAIIMALIAIPFSDYDFIFLTLRLASFAIFMYLLIKFTSGKKKVKK